jgi:hypothetical protein
MPPCDPGGYADNTFLLTIKVVQTCVSRKLVVVIESA